METARLIIENSVTTLVTNNFEIKQLLYRNLRFRDLKFFAGNKHRKGGWDGFTDFFKIDTGKFLTGLLPEITYALKVKGIKYEVQDLRKPFVFQYNQIDDKFLQQFLTPDMPKYVLEDYQVDFVNKGIRNRRGVIQSPTSSGKSLMFVSLMKAFNPDCKTLVLQNRTDLAIQNYEELARWGFSSLGKLWGDAFEIGNTMVATVQSIDKITSMLPNFDALIVDEVHDMMSARPKQVYRKLNKCHVRIGLSATPFKYASKDKVQKHYVKGFFGPVFSTTTTKSGVLKTSDLQERGRLSSSVCYFLPITSPEVRNVMWTDAVQHAMVDSMQLHDTTCSVCNALKGRTLILVDRIEHGDELFRRMPNSIWVKGKDNRKTRKAVIETLQTAKHDVVAIATQQIFNTGVNFFIHNLINAAGGKADHTIIQRMGRGLRTAKDKSSLLYIDFDFLNNEYLERHSKKRVKILTSEGHEVNHVSLEELLEIIKKLQQESPQE